MIESAARFVACADEVFRLQRGSGGECRHFQRMADQGHYRRGGGTRQGIYVFAPSGKLLASANTLDPQKVLELLDAGWVAWEALAAAERRLSPMDLVIPEPRWEDNYPEGGLVLRSTVRDLGLPGEPLAPGERHNVDFAWFTAEEARALLHPRLVPDISHWVPTELAGRLARLHLVDNVRGQTIPFAPGEIETLAVSTLVRARDADVVQIELHGLSAARSDGVWRLGDSDWGTDARLPRMVVAEWRGEASYDVAAGRFTSFRMVAFGERDGRGTVNNRHRDPGTSRLGWVFELADDSLAERIAPTFVDHYDVSWISRPATAAAPLWSEGD